MLIPDFHATPYKTLIIMDEIQECPNARSSLKYFCLDKRYDVLATRSLLGLKGYNREDSRGPSVGFETMIDMKPMDFEEFLEAKKTPDAILQKVKDCYMTLSSVPEAIHNFMLKSFNEYLIVCGMPEAVDVFLTTNDLLKLTSKNIGKGDNILTIPYYMTFLIKEYWKHQIFRL